MLEIICIIMLWRANGRNALKRGQKPTKYRALTLVLWFGLEILGTIIGAFVITVVFPNSDPFIGSYIFGVAGAALGGFLSYQFAKHAPYGNYSPDNQSQQWNQGQNPWNQNQQWNQGQNPWNQNQQWNQGQNPWNQNQQWNQEQDGWSQNPWNRGQDGWNQRQNDTEQDAWKRGPWDETNGSGNAYSYGQSQPVQGSERLNRPATIRIVEELGGYQGGQDAFYLNGFPICSLRPGSEYTFTTSNIRNTVTIGMPQQPAENKEYIVRFIAAEDGYIEIHARAGKLLPDEFKNFASK